MVQKILLQLEIDDASLDTAQAKADKLVATLKEAEEISARLVAKGKSSGSGEDMTSRLDIAREIAQAMFKPPD